MLVKNGRYGPYIAYKGKNYRLPKGAKPEELTLDDCLKIVAGSKSNRPGQEGKGLAAKRKTLPGTKGSDSETENRTGTAKRPARKQTPKTERLMKNRFSPHLRSATHSEPRHKRPTRPPRKATVSPTSKSCPSPRSRTRAAAEPAGVTRPSRSSKAKSSAPEVPNWTFRRCGSCATSTSKRP